MEELASVALLAQTPKPMLADCNSAPIGMSVMTTSSPNLLSLAYVGGQQRQWLEILRRGICMPIRTAVAAWTSRRCEVILAYLRILGV